MLIIYLSRPFHVVQSNPGLHLILHIAGSFIVTENVMRHSQEHVGQGRQGRHDVTLCRHLQVEEGPGFVVLAVVGEPTGFVVLGQLQVNL